MLICISYGICDLLSLDKSLNKDNALCFGLILKPNFSTSHILRCLDSFQSFIPGLCKYGYQSNISCSKACGIMVIKLITFGYII